MSNAETTATFMAMKGSGYYSKATAGARDTINQATHLVLEAIARLTLADGQAPLRVADFGAADGGTSVDMWRSALMELRRRAPRRPIEICYTDLPRNDFAQLFRMIHGQTEIDSYYKQIDNLYVFASGTSFHDAIFPPRTLHLGFSATASHYLSRTPRTISNHVHMVGASGAERDAYIDQGRIDWETMLSARSRELCKGARLCLFNFGIDEAGRYLGSTGGVSMFDTFNALWRGLVDDGIISSEEYVNTNFPQCYRTIDQFVAPLTGSSSPVYRAGLRLEHIETRVVRCPYARDFEQHGDAKKFAQSYVPTLRSWSEPTFSAGLASSRVPAERHEIINEFYSRYERLVAANPHGHAMDYVHVYMTCAMLA